MLVRAEACASGCGLAMYDAAVRGTSLGWPVGRRRRKRKGKRGGIGEGDYDALDALKHYVTFLMGFKRIRRLVSSFQRVWKTKSLITPVEK